MTYKFQAGDRVERYRASHNPEHYGHVGQLGTVQGYDLLKHHLGLYVLMDTGLRVLGTGDDRWRLAGTQATQAIVDEAVIAPPAPFARSSKPRPKKPIVPGSRCDQVLKHLLSGKTLTQGEAILLGYGTRLAATIHDLRRRDHNITVKMKEDIHGAPYAEYRLITRGANGNRKAA